MVCMYEFHLSFGTLNSKLWRKQLETTTHSFPQNHGNSLVIKKKKKISVDSHKWISIKGHNIFMFFKQRKFSVICILRRNIFINNLINFLALSGNKPKRWNISNCREGSVKPHNYLAMNTCQLTGNKEKSVERHVCRYY